MNQPLPTHNTGSELRFPSSASLRAAHEDLIKQRRAEGDTPEVLAEIQTFIEHGRETGRLLDGEDERRASQALLDFWSNALLRLGQDPGDATLDEFDPLLAPELPDALCPYVGLDAFSEGKTGLFFGRQRMVRTLVEKLESSRLLVVSGPSGSGKSSVVLAGLIPALKNGALPGSEGWRYIPRMVPGSDPLANLARLLWTIGGDTGTDQDAWIRDQVDHLRRDPGHLARLANQTGEAPVIGVIDQFEEVFTLCTDGEARQAFVANLLNFIQVPGSRHTVILTVRTDFESFVVLLPNFQSAFDQAVVRMTPLNAVELREAIEQPAALVGLKFESGLVDALLHDILGEPAALPLLQFTLLKLWDNRQRNLITWNAYRRLGGGRLALANSANAFYEGLIPEDKVTAQRILLRLVRPTEGLEVTSNRVRLETLLQIGEARDRQDRVLEKFFAARLLRVTEGDVAADTQVEIAHEALIRNWPRLVEWLDAERDLLRKRVRLTSAAEQWNTIGRSKDALWRGALLEEAAQYRELTDLEQEFIESSRQMQADEAMAAVRAQKREIEQARALAEAERLRAEGQQSAASRYRRLTLALAVVSVLAIGAALIALGLAQSASEQRKNAEAAGTIAVAARTTAEARLKVAEDSLGGQLDLVNQLEIVQAEKAAQAMLIQTLEASSNRTPSPTRPAPTALLPTSTRSGIATVGTPTATRTTTPTPSATSTQAVPPPSNPGATFTAEALAILRSQVQATQTAIAAGGERVTSPSTPVIPSVPTATTRPSPAPSPTPMPVFSDPRGLLVFSSNRFSENDLYRINIDGSNLSRLTDNIGFLSSYSPGANSIVFTTQRDPQKREGAALNTISPSGGNERNIDGRTSDNWEPAFSRDGRRVAFVSSRDGRWDIYTMNNDGSDVRRLTNDEARDYSPSWSPDGQQIVFASELDTGRDRPELYMMNADGTGRRRLTFSGVFNAHPAWSPNGRSVVFASDRSGNRDIWLLDLDSIDAPVNLTRSRDVEQYPAWSPDGQWIAFDRLDPTRQTADILIMTRTGDRITRVTTEASNDWRPNWLPSQ